MAKRLQRASDLPEWFDPEKYSAAGSLDTAGWYEQLCLRRDLFGLVGSYLWDRRNGQDPSQRGDNLAEVLAIVRQAPIVDVTANELLRVYFYGGAMHELRSRNPLYSHGVHLTTVRNFYLTEGNIEKEKRDFAKLFFGQIFETDRDWTQPLKYKCEDWIDEPVDNIVEQAGVDVNVRVNMLLPDSVLIDRFKQMLQSVRNEMQRTRFGGLPNWRKPDFASWIRFGVLPFLDLLLWQRETGMSIPNRVMADAIYAPGEGGEEVVRKTTSKLADELMSRRYLEALCALAAYEISERSAG